MNPVISFLASGTGRIVRVVAGIILVAWGWFGLAGLTGTVVALIGLVPLFGAPLSGPKIRAGK